MFYDVGHDEQCDTLHSNGPSDDIGERRQVTILFADLSGYTSLAARRDPEETPRILGRFFEAVDGAVTRYGGAIERHISDNVMGVFGAPVAHHDDPYRAVKAAGEIHRAVNAVSADLGIVLSVHIGIAAGTVMASGTGSSLKAAYGVVGSPVNLAARLQAKAAAGETLISNSLKRAIENIFEHEPLGEVAIKGARFLRARLARDRRASRARCWHCSAFGRAPCGGQAPTFAARRRGGIGAWRRRLCPRGSEHRQESHVASVGGGSTRARLFEPCCPRPRFRNGARARRDQGAH